MKSIEIITTLVCYALKWNQLYSLSPHNFNTFVAKLVNSFGIFIFENTTNFFGERKTLRNDVL